MGKIYSVVNGAAPGAAATAKVATGTAIKTLIQLATISSRELRVVQHWIECDGSSAATPGQYELVRAGGGNCTTMTAYAAGDIVKVNDPNSVASSISLGTSASGYSATAEVTPSSTPVTIEQHLVPPTSGIYIQFPQGREPEVQASAFLRSRVTFGATVNVINGIMWEE